MVLKTNPFLSHQRKALKCESTKFWCAADQSVLVWKHQVLVFCGPNRVQCGSTKFWSAADQRVGVTETGNAWSIAAYTAVCCCSLTHSKEHARRSIMWPIGKQVLQREDDNLKNSCFLTKDQENINSVYFSVFNDNYHTFCDTVTLTDDKVSYCRNKTRKKFYSD